MPGFDFVFNFLLQCDVYYRKRISVQFGLIHSLLYMRYMLIWFFMYNKKSPDQVYGIWKYKALRWTKILFVKCK